MAKFIDITDSFIHVEWWSFSPKGLHWHKSDQILIVISQVTRLSLNTDFSMFIVRFAG